MNTALTDIFALAKFHHLAGRLHLAEQFYIRLVAENPEHAEALHLLGVLSQQCGDHGAALDYYRRAVACPGAQAAHWNNLGTALIVAGNLVEASAACERALRMNPGYAEAFNNLGICRHYGGEVDHAISCFQQALLHREAYPEALNNLGQALHAKGESDEAQAAFEQALRLKPDYADAVNGLGMVLHERGHVERAVELYRQALRLQPNFVDASNNLATALKEQGLLDEALAQYRATLKLQPQHALANYNLSQFAAEGWFRFEPEHLDRIQKILTAKRGSVVERSVLSFSLASVLEQQGRYDEAFAHYYEANEMRRQLQKENNQAFDAEAHIAYIDRLIASFGTSFFQNARDWGTDTEQPIFIVGMPRSGTTLVEQILASHPKVFGVGELGEIPRMAARLAQQVGRSRLDFAPTMLNTAAARVLAADFLRLQAAVSGGAERVANKALGNYAHLGLIAILFPRARIIACHRDPRDVCVSCYFQNFQNLNLAWSLEDLGVYHRQYDRLMAHWKQVLPVPIHEVSYSTLIASPKDVIRDMLAYCNLDWDDRCLQFFNNRRTVRTASTLQVRKPLSGKSIGRWRRFQTHLDPLMQALGLSTADEKGKADRRTESVAYGVSLSGQTHA
jgi:tetratricopeptide (TPR) repeat protein